MTVKAKSFDWFVKSESHTPSHTVKTDQINDQIVKNVKIDNIAHPDYAIGFTWLHSASISLKKKGKKSYHSFKLLWII